MGGMISHSFGSSSSLSLLQFELFADAIEDVLRIQFKALFTSMRGLSRSVTTEAIALNMTFPFVTLNNFEVFGKLARDTSGLETIEFSPFVESHDVTAFEAYAQAHADGWIQSSRATEQAIDAVNNTKIHTNNGVVYEDFDIVPFIYDVSVDPETGEPTMTPVSGNGPFSPLWHFTPPPVSPFLIMSNTFSVNEDPHPQDGTRGTQGKKFKKRLCCLFF